VTLISSCLSKLAKVCFSQWSRFKGLFRNRILNQYTSVSNTIFEKVYDWAVFHVHFWRSKIVFIIGHRVHRSSCSIVFIIEVLNFFQASLRNCINCVHCDYHFFIFISFPQFIYDLFHISLTKLKALQRIVRSFYVVSLYDLYWYCRRRNIVAEIMRTLKVL